MSRRRRRRTLRSAGDPAPWRSSFAARQARSSARATPLPPPTFAAGRRRVCIGTAAAPKSRRPFPVQVVPVHGMRRSGVGAVMMPHHAPTPEPARIARAAARVTARLRATASPGARRRRDRRRDRVAPHGATLFHPKIIRRIGAAVRDRVAPHGATLFHSKIIRRIGAAVRDRVAPHGATLFHPSVGAFLSMACVAQAAAP